MEPATVISHHRWLVRRSALFDDERWGCAVREIGGAGLRAQGLHIRVNSIHPGVTETDMGHQVFTKRAHQLGTNDLDAACRQSLDRLPIGRLGSATDIAEGIIFLALDDSAS
jgi:NAD(P)-dependent dehydrogenase (short-subunit alcohol dehydrogenase family)